jgi:hypothetical protein
LASSNALTFIKKSTCPFCWSSFEPVDVLWISSHQELTGDPRLGHEEQLRFLPSSFTVDGEAIDLRGMPCRGLACPSCHLPLPRPVIEYEPLFVSILGTPSCGKTYYLTALSWQMRQILPRDFAISFADADPTFNVGITEGERMLFLNENPKQAVPLASLIEKTKLAGERYQTVYEGDHGVRFLKPYLFTIRVSDKHPNFQRASELSRLLVLYDNAGEHFMPGREEPGAPVTQHMAKSEVLLFLFDPTQDPRFRRLYETVNPDAALMNLRSERQDMVLREAAARVRRLLGLKATAKHKERLVIVVTKCDTWSKLIDDDLSIEPWRVKNGLAGLDRDRIAKRSDAIRSLLEKTCPEVVAAAEDFSAQVVYMGVSALGRAPVPLEARNADGAKIMVPGIRPIDIKPSGVIVPFLHALNAAVPGLTLRITQPGESLPSKQSLTDAKVTTWNQ